MKTLKKGTRSYNPLIDSFEQYLKLKDQTISENLTEINNKIIVLDEFHKKYKIKEYGRIRKNLVEQKRYWRKKKEG